MRTQAIRPRRVHAFVSSIFDHDLHEKRVPSLADATVGALQGAQLAVGALGRALAVARELDGKHAIKQVDRLFSNTGVDVWRLFGNWMPFVVSERLEIVVALDWTDFDQDNQSTIALYLVTRHGRATPQPQVSTPQPGPFQPDGGREMPCQAPVSTWVSDAWRRGQADNWTDPIPPIRWLLRGARTAVPRL